MGGKQFLMIGYVEFYLRDILQALRERCCKHLQITSEDLLLSIKNKGLSFDHREQRKKERDEESDRERKKKEKRKHK